jgi:hypothetical protein
MDSLSPAALLLIFTSPVWFPVVVYFGFLAGRYAWLRAEQLFFSERD